MYTIKTLSGIKKEIRVAPDKSISHRALMLSAIASGPTVIEPFLRCDDTAATMRCLQTVGVDVNHSGGDSVLINGQGRYFPCAQPITLNASESGTTMRILSGLLVGQNS